MMTGFGDHCHYLGTEQDKIHMPRVKEGMSPRNLGSLPVIACDPASCSVGAYSIRHCKAAKVWAPLGHLPTEQVNSSTGSIPTDEGFLRANPTSFPFNPALSLFTKQAFHRLHEPSQQLTVPFCSIFACSPQRKKPGIARPGAVNQTSATLSLSFLTH